MLPRLTTLQLRLTVGCLTLMLNGTMAWCQDTSVGSNSGRLAKALQPFVDREELAGAVMLVATPDKVLLAEPVGFADRSQGEAMKVDSLFWIASQSKPMTAVALMMLVDEGKVKLDDPVEKFLPEFHDQKVVKEKDADHVLLKRPETPITLRHLLSHTSGLPFRSAIEVPTLDRLPLADRVRSYAMTPLESEPNTRYQYSNAGINTAARVIEVVTGKPFETFLQERLFDPLGMSQTTFWPDRQQEQRVAKAYKPGPQGKGLEVTKIDQLQYPLSDRRDRYPMPAGGLFSTAADVANFYQMMAQGGQWQGKRLLSESAVSQLTRKQTAESIPIEYGLGFSTGGGRFGHGGAYSTHSSYDQKHGLILIWLVQHAGFPGEGQQSQEVFRAQALELFGKKGPR